MRRALVVAAIIGVAAPARAQEVVTPATLKLPDGPGSVAGLADAATLDVFTAEVSYAVPIRVPQVRRLSPALSLGYSGALGNGPVGVGWTLGVPAIRRSLRHGVPRYDASDELVLEGIGGGGRLVASGGGEFRIEGQGQRVRVQQVGARFEVTDADGTRYLLGVTPDGRHAADGRTAAWFAEIVVDTAGDEVLFDYSHQDGEIYLDRVEWGPDRVYQVTFVYEARADRVVSYRTGFRVETGLRLASVEVRAFTEILAKYELGYDERFALSRLAAVRVTGRGGEGEQPPLALHYANPGPATVEAVAGAGGWTLGTRGVTFADVDGDGVSDLLRLELGNHEWRKNLGGAFGGELPLAGASSIELAAARLLDLDGDARAELVRVVDDTWRAYGMSEAGFSTRGVVTGTDGLPLIDGLLADLNGDGRTDVVRATAEGLLVNLASDTGIDPAFLAPRVSAVDPPVDPGQPSVRFVDWNGDGLADVIWLTDAWMKVFLGRGDGVFETWDRVFWPWGAGAFDLSALHFADLNRDGLMDVVRVVGGNVLWYAGTGEHRLATIPRHVARPEATTSDVRVAIADANGNGSDDLVWSSPRGMWALDLAGPTTAGMLAAIENGLGATTTFRYEASGVLSLADEAAGQPWARKLPVSIPVPIRQETVLASGEPTRVARFGVRDGFWDGAERRFGGFLTGVRVVDGNTPTEARVEETRYHAGTGDERVLRGVAWYARVEDGAGVIYTVTESDWEVRPVAGLPDVPLLRRAFLRAARTHHFEGVTEALVTEVLFAPDAEGRTRKEVHLGRLDMDGDERVVLRRYASDDETWVRDRVCEEQLLTADATVVASTRSYFGDDTRMEALCVVGKGWPRLTEAYLAEEDRWVVLGETRYDAQGNPVEVYAEGVTRLLAYDAAGLFPVREAVMPESGVELAWEMTWDQVLGKPLTLTDPNGDVTRVAYDALGRVETMAVNDDAAHVRYEYAWFAPRPTTTTFVNDGRTADGPWRETRAVANGAGEALYAATRLEGDTFITSGWTERDGRGRVTVAADAFYSDGRPTVRPAASTVQTFQYDALDRLVVQTLPSGARKGIAYRAFATTETADELAPVSAESDGLGRVLTTERTVDGTREWVAASYDPAGRIVAMRLQGGLVEHSFTYDTLGRLVAATDPDIGARALGYDDAGRLIAQTNGAGQTVRYGYDGAGRLLWRTADEDGTSFAYHYDEPVGGDPSVRTRGRLASVTEPTGEVAFAYDQYGHRAGTVRTIFGQQAAEEVTYSPSGLVLGVRYWEEEFGAEIDYDGAGRALRVRGAGGPLWEVVSQDAAGRVLEQRFGNGVRQVMAYDSNGQPTHVSLVRPGAGGALFYDVALTRNAYGAVTRASDGDGTGLNHSAAFTYDLAARLRSAAMGSFDFRYQYDGLQNMVSRSATGPRDLGLLQGTYVHGAPGFGPRQLASVVAPDGAVHAFAYDAAGRVIADGSTQLTYNGLDQLVRVLPAGSAAPVEHGYGYDGLRTFTRDPAGNEEYWFTPNLRQHGDTREHYVRIGDRIIARISQARPPTAPPAMGAVIVWRVLVATLALLCMGLLGAALRRAVRTGGRWKPAVAVATIASFVATLAPGCTYDPDPDWKTAETIYFHYGFGAGPTVLTRADGSILEERRYEPFGQPIDAYREPVGGLAETGLVDHAHEPHNSLNKETDATTGWSYHGARWTAPQTGQWLTPDPPVKAPDPKFMAAPWDLNPYQYARQNPVVYWDPDGRIPLAAACVVAPQGCAAGAVVVAKGAVFVASAAAAAAVAIWAWGRSPKPQDYVPPSDETSPVPWQSAQRSPKESPRTIDVAPNAPGPDEEPDQGPLIYVTYFKVHPTEGRVYVGRTRGYGDPQSIVDARDVGHHKDAEGYGPAQLDEFTVATLPFVARHLDPAYQAIRGREQQFIDFFGGAWSDVGEHSTASGNSIRGVAADNPLGKLYHNMASQVFSEELHPYTGD